MSIPPLFALAAAVAASAPNAPTDPRDLAYQAHTVADAQRQLGVQNPEPGPKLLLEAPDIVAGTERGTVTVQLKLTTRMPGTDWMALLVEGADPPLLVHKDFTPGNDQTLESKVKLSATSRVRAVVRVAGKYYQVSREVKVARPAHPPSPKP